MPRTPVNYQKSIIYEIVPKDNSINWKHISFTTDFIKRKNYIKSCCIKGKDNPICNFINENGGISAFEILAIKEAPATNSEFVKSQIFHLNHPHNLPTLV
tara:strand:+ start:93 stop:392 length:300 start_codon:yes stop_codon:yes gene_type:complete